MKVLYVATVVKTHIMEFHVPYLKMFKEMGWETAVAAGNDYENPDECSIPFCDTYFDIPFERSPLKFGNIKAFINLKKIIDEGAYDIIHCHTPVGALLTRLAAIKARKRGTKVFYTAHGFHFYKGAPLINWLVYYPVERLLAHFTDVLITINKDDFARAKKFKAKRVEYVPGVGIDLSKFSCTAEEKEKLRKIIFSRHNIPINSKLLLSVGEFTKNKNHKMAIEAVAKLHRDDVYYIICGSGALLDKCKEYTKNLGLNSKVIFCGYRNDVSDYYKAADIFLFPSYREGLPVALLEALASGLPAVCTNIRGSADLVENGFTGYTVGIDFCEFAEAITCVLNGELESTNNAKKFAVFELDNILNQIKALYLREIEFQN